MLYTKKDRLRVYGKEGIRKIIRTLLTKILVSGEKDITENFKIYSMINVIKRSKLKIGEVRVWEDSMTKKVLRENPRG